AVVIGHVRPVDRAQRHAHRCRNRGLSHPALAQQHHLDALALRGRYLPSQRRFQPAHFGFAAFGHLFPPNQMATANHSSWPENNSRAAQLPQTFRFKQLWSWYDIVVPSPAINEFFTDDRIKLVGRTALETRTVHMPD